MKIYTIADHIISPLGAGTAANFSGIRENRKGVARHDNRDIFPDPLHAAIINRDDLPFSLIDNYTFLENLLIHSIGEILTPFQSLISERFLLIISTTKGNIDLVDSQYKGSVDKEAVFLPKMADRVNQHFNFPNSPVLVSNACISGVSAILTAKKLIQAGLYDHVLVAGVDIITEFVLSGFHSFMALSDGFCRPYDKDRNGINIGEACASVLLSNNADLRLEEKSFAEVIGGGQSNDANHISGPSRTGEGLIIAVQKALKEAGVPITEIDYINAHGTATLFNDEMEAQAFDHFGANDIPLNSLKGYFGHTLGASGVIESIMAVWQMNHDLLVKSVGYDENGLTKPLNVLAENQRKETRAVLKTASGFGGCNGAVIFKKI